MRLLNPGFTDKKDFLVFCEVEDAALKLLERDLSKSKKELYYHSVGHTLSVLKHALKFGKAEGLESRKLLLLAVAALFHDTGYGDEYEKNEFWGAKRAKLVLPKYGFSSEEIETIKDIIMATQLHADMKARPRNHLESVMCDADLVNVGFPTKKYVEISEKLRKEFGVEDEVIWIESQLKFFDAHEFHTESALKWGMKQKARNRKFLEKRLKKLRKVREKAKEKEEKEGKEEEKAETEPAEKENLSN
ncbi:HD domain-containing protein [Nanoarchaeota archaeon]